MTQGASMKFQSLSKVSLFFSCIILCLLFIVPVSGAEPLDNMLSKQVLSTEGPKTAEGSLQEKEISPAVLPATAAEDQASTYDVKIPLGERFKAFFSLGDLNMRDLSGRGIGHNYSAGFGLQIALP
jgi:hypothetical protein